MDNEKRLIVFFVFSFLILFVWFRVWAPPASAPAAEKRISRSGSAGLPVAKGTEAGETIIEAVIPDREIVSPVSKAVLSEKGELIGFYMKEKEREVDMLLKKEAYPFILEVGGARPGDWKKEKDGYAASYGSLRIKKDYRFAEQDYWNRLTLELENRSAEERNIDLRIIWPSALGIEEALKKENEKSLSVWIHSGKKVLKVKPPKNGLQTDASWIALTNRYFLVAILSPLSQAWCRKEGNFPEIGAGGPLLLKPGEKKILEFRFLVAPKSYFYLEKQNMGLEKTMGFGTFGALSVLFLKILKFLYGIFGNYGWAIVVLTVLIQLLTFPLTTKNLKSMSAMKRLQPYMEQLKKKYKDDPQKLNAEMLHLYKLKGVNPLGGCLPMILQIPVFWGLFTMLRGTVELRGAEFILWIKDLAAPDTLFGHFPKGLPLLGGWPGGPLPLLMGVVMFLQQKNQATDPQSKSMLWMPFFFTFMFFQFPSGLVLYWLERKILP